MWGSGQHCPLLVITGFPLHTLELRLSFIYSPRQTQKEGSDDGLATCLVTFTWISS